MITYITIIFILNKLCFSSSNLNGKMKLILENFISLRKF